MLYSPGPILSAVSVTHAGSALSALMMTGVAIVALLYRPQKRVLRTVGWASIFIFTVYLLNTYVIFLYGAYPDRRLRRLRQSGTAFPRPRLQALASPGRSH